MFTGIIAGKGKILEKRPLGGGMLFAVEADFDLPDPEEGESIAVNGVCLTATTIRGRRFTVDVSPESLSRTILGELAVGDLVNLERALKISDRLGGHLVSGHVDGVSRVLERKPEGDFTRFTFSVQPELARYIIEKGSITVNGISLTVNRCDDLSFSVAIIPHTLAVTTLGEVQQGDRVNIEVDLIGKYVEKLLGVRGEGPTQPASGINPEFLRKFGFM
ncbi:MAG: riboflavin synthase [Thermodesulfobacteriota bacterium]